MPSSQTVECAWCGKRFQKATKRINQTERGGKQHCCSRSCASKLENEQRRCDPTTKNAANTRRDKEKFPEKNTARSLVRQAIKSGQIVPPLECEVCYTECITEGHHPDHNRPFLLVFLCKKCHKKADSSDDKWESLATDHESV